MINPRDIDEHKFYAIEGRDLKRVSTVMQTLHGIIETSGIEQWDLAKQLELVFDNGVELE